MAEVDLGNVKGDKLEWADLTDADKAEITPGIYPGNVTTLDAGQNATITLRKDQNGKINTFDFGIPKGKDGTEITVATFDDTTSTYTTITDANTDAESNLNKIVSGKKVSEIFTNIKRALSGMIQSLKIFNTNVGAIKGITSDLTATDPQYAASITSLSEVNRNLSDSISTLNNKMLVKSNSVAIACYFSKINGHDRVYSASHYYPYGVISAKVTGVEMPWVKFLSSTEAAKIQVIASGNYFYLQCDDAGVVAQIGDKTCIVTMKIN